MTTEERIHALANEIGEAYTADLLPEDLAHRWITELTIILAQVRSDARNHAVDISHARADAMRGVLERAGWL